MKATESKESIQGPRLGVQEWRSETAATSHPSGLLPSFRPLGSQDSRVDQATKISAWQEPAPQPWPSSSNLTPPALSMDHFFQEPSYKYPLLKCLPPQAPSPPALRLPVLGSGNASSQSVYHLSPLRTPSTDGLPKLGCGTALASPQDCRWKLTAQQFLLKTLMNIQ